MESEISDESDDWDPEIQTKTIFDRKVIVFNNKSIKQAQINEIIEEEKFEKQLKAG